MVIDIASGATWGYKAINDITRKDYSFFNEFGQGGGVSVAMPDSSDGAAERFSFHPTNEWTTKFFVTPIGHDMDYSNNLAEIHIVSAGTGIEGVYDRNGIRHQFPEIEKSVRCTGVINLEDMIGSSVLSEIDDIGGWTWATVDSGNAIVYKLEYVVNNPTYGGTNNNAILLPQKQSLQEALF